MIPRLIIKPTTAVPISRSCRDFPLPSSPSALSRPTKAFQTDDSWNYSCRHPTNLIITSCTITVSSILRVIKAWWVCVCVCARTCACVSVRVLSAPWCLCLLSLERDALWFRCLFDSQFNNFLQTASPSSFLQRHFKSSLYFSKLESELFAVHSKWVFSWVLPHTQLSPQHRNQNHKVEKKKQQRFLPRTVPALLNSGWGMLADSSVHFLCWCGRPQSSNRFNSTAREPSWSFYFLALLRLRASRRCLSW